MSGQTHKSEGDEPEHMKPLAVVGPSDAETAALVERLAERLGDRGRVGTVTRTTADPGRDGPPHQSAAVTQSYQVGDGAWRARGDSSLSPGDALDRLAPSCDYALVRGWDDTRLPTVVLGEPGASEDTSGEILQRAPTADEIDLSALLESLESVEAHETLESLVERVKASPRSDRAGAIATFTGRVRTRDGPDDDPTEHLEFEKYDGVADERMARLREELESRDGVHEVRLHHRTGVVEAEEDIVFVVVLAGHRPEAFRTVEDGIDRLKEEVPLFKKEVTVSGEFWAHEH